MYYHRTCTRLSRSMVELSSSFQLNDNTSVRVLQPHTCQNIYGLGYSPFARHYSENRCFFLLLQVLRCFSSLRMPHLMMVPGLQPGGLPHSDTAGSTHVC